MNIPARFASLPFHDKKLVVLSVTLLVFFKIAVRIFPLKTLLSLTGRVIRRPNGQENPPPRTDRVLWAVPTVARHAPFLNNCLVIALTTRALLGMEGCSSTLRVGVAKQDKGGLTAHAWLELEGGIVIDSEGNASYTPLPRFDGVDR